MRFAFTWLALGLLAISSLTAGCGAADRRNDDGGDDGNGGSSSSGEELACEAKASDGPCLTCVKAGCCGTSDICRDRPEDCACGYGCLSDSTPLICLNDCGLTRADLDEFFECLDVDCSNDCSF